MHVRQYGIEMPCSHNTSPKHAPPSPLWTISLSFYTFSLHKTNPILPYNSLFDYDVKSTLFFVLFLMEVSGQNQ